MLKAINPQSRKRFLSSRYFVGKIREHGLRGLLGIIWARILSKYKRFYYPLKQKTVDFFTAPIYGRKKRDNTLYAFYDLEVSAVTFDIVPFMVLAENRRMQINCKRIHLMIIPGSFGGFKQDAEISFYDKQWRLKNILIPSGWLIPNCESVTVFGSRNEAKEFLQHKSISTVYPMNSTLNNPRKGYRTIDAINASKDSKRLPSINSSKSALNYIKEWLNFNVGSRKPIVITLRECQYRKSRNSNLEEWARFARNLCDDYCPIILRDTDKEFHPIPEVLKDMLLFSAPVWNVDLRTALYELAYLHLHVNDGPGALCLHNHRSRWIRFKMLPSNDSELAKKMEKWNERDGIFPGMQFPWTTSFQKCVWENDKYEVIMREFETMCGKIEKHEQEDKEITVAKKKYRDRDI